MGKLTLEDLGITFPKNWKPKKLDLNDPEVKEMIQSARKQQEETLKQKIWTQQQWDNMRIVINI